MYKHRKLPSNWDFYVNFLVAPFYTLCDQYITVQINRQVPYYQVPLNDMLTFKSLHWNLLNTMNLCTLKTDLGCINIWHRKFWTTCRLILFKSNYTVVKRYLLQLYVFNQCKIYPNWTISILVMFTYHRCVPGKIND